MMEQFSYESDTVSCFHFLSLKIEVLHHYAAWSYDQIPGVFNQQMQLMAVTLRCVKDGMGNK